jgi:hypothetical protein
MRYALVIVSGRRGILGHVRLKDGDRKGGGEGATRGFPNIDQSNNSHFRLSFHIFSLLFSSKAFFFFPLFKREGFFLILFA